MRESDIEKYLVSQCRRRGYECRKNVSPGRRGPLDRLVLASYPVMAFVEVKAPEGHTSSAQDREIVRLEALGYPVYVLQNKDSVDSLMLLLERQVSELKPKKPKPKPKPMY